MAVEAVHSGDGKTLHTAFDALKEGEMRWASSRFGRRYPRHVGSREAAYASKKDV
jgi:hypothetical protein